MGKQQTSLISFFAAAPKGAAPAAAATSPVEAKAPPAIPKFRLKVTQVRKKVAEAVCENDKMQIPPLFVMGFLVEFHPKTEDSAAQKEHEYTVEWEDDESFAAANSGSRANAPHHNNKTRERWTESQVSANKKLYHHLDSKIAKKFDQGVFVGQVVDVLPAEDEGEYLYQIWYEEDGDFEDFDEADLRNAQKKYKTEGNNKVTAKQAPPKRRAAKSPAPKRSARPSPPRSSERVKRIRTNYAESDDDVDMDEAMASDDDDEAFTPVSKVDEDEDSDGVILLEDSDDDTPVTKKNKESNKKTTARTAKTPAKRPETASKNTKPVVVTPGASTADGKLSKQDHECIRNFELDYQKKLKKGEYKPTNNPQKIDEGSTFVEPVGVDPTHGIIEGIISEQVRKVGGLLDLVKAEASKKGELCYPIELQTACSGTDAPSIALGLIKESYDKMRPGNAFQYNHSISCEIEPFKQAYLARNFGSSKADGGESLKIFPDITKLSATDEAGNPKPVVDVYGRLQTIPSGNLFVAGTSCKDFSMLKTTYRKDIEDKGTSGETFLAAVEFLELYAPPMAIFENVINAPWEKMQEYIQGRIRLANRNDGKNITAKGKRSSTKKKAKVDDDDEEGGGGSNSKYNADDDLIFTVREDLRYEAAAVPAQVGMKAGDVVEGFIHGKHKDKIQSIVASKDDVRKEVSLRKLSKKHGIDLEADTLVLEKKARYCTHLVKLDTKDYGLPQTRNRKYLFIWLSDDPNDDLGGYFDKILEHLQTPLLHSVDAFLLPDSHDRIRCFREALRSGPGLMVKRERAKENDFWDPLSRVKDTILHKIFRVQNGLPDRMRWLTEWGTRSRKKLAPGLWPELFDCWNMRRLDMIDCFAGAAIRDAIPRDCLHHLFMWDISQNVTRAPYRSAAVGVSGCVTPGGELLVPHLGRTIMGYEKLLLQGIPFSRLVLGQETEVQCSDLAGNAMSMSVISATILAAVCAPQLRKQSIHNFGVSLKNFRLSLEHDDAKGAVLAARGDLKETARSTIEGAFEDSFQSIARDLSEEAFRSSVLCTCESSGTVSKDPTILQCMGCGWMCCHSCSDRYQTSSHDLFEVNVSEIAHSSRPDPHVFERKLRSAAPSLLCLGEGSEKLLRDGAGLEAYGFQLQQVERKKGHWQLTYGAWEDHGSGRQVAETRVVVGRLSALDSVTGVSAFVRCFAPAIREVRPYRGKLSDSARLQFPKGAEGSNTQWEVPGKSQDADLKIVGSNPVDSLRAMIGLADKAAKDLRSQLVKRSYAFPFQSRNPLTHYPDDWKIWPGTLEVSNDPSCQVNGIYQKLNCRHTICLSALWRREGDKPMYLYFRPNVLRSGLDTAVFSPSPSYADGMEVVELGDWIPENSFHERTQTTKARILSWDSATALTVLAPASSVQLLSQPTPFHESFVNSIRNDLPDPILCELANLPLQVVQSLLEYNNVAGQRVASLDLFGKLGTRNAKRMSIVAAPTLLKAAARGELSLPLSKWLTMPKISVPLGKCPLNVPLPPKERWLKRDDNTFERVYDPKESDEYYQKLMSRPDVFKVDVDTTNCRLIIRMNPVVAAHRAAALLCGGDGELSVEYQVAELSSMGEPIAKAFVVPNSDQYEPTSFVDKEMTLPLYPRQAKALTRMIDIESGTVSFEEEERSEHVLPGIGWCLIAKAGRSNKLAGGVLGDAIGSGKTVITIALILKQVYKARASRDPENGRSGATLIVVPPGLVRQWDDERKKFTGNQLKSIVIDSTMTLLKYSVKDLCEADIVIAPAGILEEGKSRKSRPYTENLSKKAKAGVIPPAPTFYSQREAPTIEGTWVRNMQSGPEIYVGNKGNQKYRDQLAYYSYQYSDAVVKLRQQSFSPQTKGVPFEYFTWERIIIDECHETLVSSQDESKLEDFGKSAKQGARQFLGVSQTSPSKRPLVAAVGVWGLSGTPLLETEARITELASLCGGTYVTGAAHHWRRDETFSGRDLFLSQIEGTKSREYRCAVSDAAHSYVQAACQRNRGEQLEVDLVREQIYVQMSEEEGRQFLKITSPLGFKNYDISADQLGERTFDLLSLTASSSARHDAFAAVLDKIASAEPEEKIIVFATSRGYGSALKALKSTKKNFCHVSNDDPVEQQNEVISWFRHADATDEDRQRPRILLLNFAQAAGHNLQEACHNVIIFDPYYSGSDAVADASVEEQCIGRVYRQGQTRDVTVTRIMLQGPNSERCVDDWIVERNLNDEVLRAATSNF